MKKQFLQRTDLDPNKDRTTTTTTTTITTTTTTATNGKLAPPKGNPNLVSVYCILYLLSIGTLEEIRPCLEVEQESYQAKESSYMSVRRQWLDL